MQKFDSKVSNCRLLITKIKYDFAKLPDSFEKSCEFRNRHVARGRFDRASRYARFRIINFYARFTTDGLIIAEVQTHVARLVSLERRSRFLKKNRMSKNTILVRMFRTQLQITKGLNNFSYL